MQILDKKGGLLLQASAGNGKTYVAKQIAKHTRSKGGQVKIIAPTNKSSLNIGGSTIHKFLRIDKKGCICSKFLKLVKEAYQYIIIDEISMIGKELWKKISLLKINSNIKFLLLGDEKQCPPVENEDIDDYFNHPAVKSICNYNRNILDVRKRYDEKLYNILKDVNNIEIDYIKEHLTERNICYFNKTRKRINKYWNDKKKKDGDLFIPADEENDKTQDMYIYEGLPVICMKTKHDGDDVLIANSESFNVGNIDDEYISLYSERPDENGEKQMYFYDCPIEEFSDYFLLNYCSTTHKSQGETITEKYTIYDWDCMTTKIKYTALSRAVKYENVYFGR
jgi:ATP-dependent exoDNAse (exonuclease V) alpha subunit